MSPRSLNFWFRSPVVRIISRAVSWRFLLVSVKSKVDHGLPTCPLWQNTQSTFSAALYDFISLMTSSGAIVFGRISTFTSFSGFQSSIAGFDGCCARATETAARRAIAVREGTHRTFDRRIIATPFARSFRSVLKSRGRPQPTFALRATVGRPRFRPSGYGGQAPLSPFGLRWAGPAFALRATQTAIIGCRAFLRPHLRLRRPHHRQRDPAVPYLAGDLRPERRGADAGDVAARAGNATRLRPLRGPGGQKRRHAQPRRMGPSHPRRRLAPVRGRAAAARRRGSPCGGGGGRHAGCRR